MWAFWSGVAVVGALAREVQRGWDMKTLATPKLISQKWIAQQEAALRSCAPDSPIRAELEAEIAQAREQFASANALIEDRRAAGWTLNRYAELKAAKLPTALETKHPRGFVRRVGAAIEFVSWDAAVAEWTA